MNNLTKEEAFINLYNQKKKYYIPIIIIFLTPFLLFIPGIILYLKIENHNKEITKKINLFLQKENDKNLETKYINLLDNERHTFKKMSMIMFLATFVLVICLFVALILLLKFF